VRLGLLGACQQKPATASLERAAEFLLMEEKVTRAIYLGADDALEEVVGAWARRLVGEDPTDDGAWHRAALLASKGAPDAIDGFVKAERIRLRLRSLESLPHRILRTMEMVGDRIAVLIHDKGLLDAEDILAANLLVYGLSETPLVKKIGARWFLTPGPLGPTGGILILDDAQDEIVATVYDGRGKSLHSEQLLLPRTSTMQIQGGGGGA
jgi:hypothetical protein